MRTRNGFSLPSLPSFAAPAAWLAAARLASVWILCAPWSIAHAGAATIDFDDFASGTLLTTQLQAGDGVVFPSGVVAMASVQARSSPNVSVALPLNEFARRGWIARFTSGQSEVTVHVEAETSVGVAHSALLVAYDEPTGGRTVASSRVNWTGGGGWQSISIFDLSGTGRIRRVELSGGPSGFETSNLLLVDDLSYAGSPPPPPLPPDTAAPALEIDAPITGAVVSAPVVGVRVSAEDDRDLFRVAGNVVHTATAIEVGLVEYCGSSVSGPCPNPLSASRIVSLSPTIEGMHRITITACDGSDNCTTRARDFSLDLPEAPPPVTAVRAELNQGVQTELSLLPDRGLPGFASGAVRLVAGRDTLVRYYIFGQGAPRPSFTARLRLRIAYRDGTAIQRATAPNLRDSSTVDLIAHPTAVLEELQMMRVELSRTLNFVVPGDLLRNATSFELVLDDGTVGGDLTGRLIAVLNPEVRLAVHQFEVAGPAIAAGSGDATPDQIENSYLYLEKAYPVSEVAVDDAGSAIILPDPYCELIFSIGGSSDPGLSCALWHFSHFGAPGPAPLDHIPTYEVALGIVPFGAFSRVGIASGRHVLVTGYNDAAFAHEIGHAAGRPHASSAHDEAGGEEWPHPHGLAGGDAWGAIMKRDVEPGPFDLGVWEAFLIDPCPATSFELRGPDCAAPAEGVGTHDFMSYGRSSTDLGILNFASFGRNWISRENWNRIYDRLLDQGRTAESGLTSSGVRSATAIQVSEASVDALLIDGVISEDGRVELLPVLRLAVRPDALQPPAKGPYQLELRDSAGKSLLVRRFSPAEQHDSGASQVFLMRQFVPLLADLARVRVRHRGKIVLDRSRSASPPLAELIEPNGGEILAGGLATLAWSVEDADGDPLLSRLEYSSDGGVTWVGLGVVSGSGALALEIDTGSLTASSRGLFRLLVSDGMRTVEERSDCFVSVRSDPPPPCEPDADQDDVPDARDRCPQTPLGSRVNEGGCSIAQLCPCDRDWKNHGRYVRCVVRKSAAFLSASLITRAQWRSIVLAAVRSKCGASRRRARGR